MPITDKITVLGEKARHNSSDPYVQKLWDRLTSRFFVLEDPDFALRKDPEIYERMLLDPVVADAVQERLHKVAGRGWVLTADDDRTKKLLRFHTHLLKGIQGFRLALYNLSRAVIEGLRLAEIQGEFRTFRMPGDSEDRRWWVPLRLVDVSKQRVRQEVFYEPDETIRTKWILAEAGKRNSWRYIEHPEWFVWHRYGDDELSIGHGTGLGRSLYYFWYLKTLLIEWAARAAERYGEGFLVAKLKAMRLAMESGAGGATLSDAQDDFYEAFEKARARHLMILDAEDELTNVEPGGQGWNMLMALIEYADGKMEQLLQGKENSDDQVGSMAREVEQGENADDVIAFDQATLAETVTRDVVGIVHRMNWHNWLAMGYASAPAPQFALRNLRRADPEKELNTVAVGQKTGLTFSVEEAYERIGWRQPAPGEPILQAPQPEPPGGGGGLAALLGGGGGSQFAAGDGLARFVATIAGEVAERMMSAFGRGEPCKQGETRARTGCIPKERAAAKVGARVRGRRNALVAARKRAQATEGRVKELEAQLAEKRKGNAQGQSEPPAAKPADKPAQKMLEPGPAKEPKLLMPGPVVEAAEAIESPEKREAVVKYLDDKRTRERVDRIVDGRLAREPSKVISVVGGWVEDLVAETWDEMVSLGTGIWKEDFVQETARVAVTAATAPFVIIGKAIAGRFSRATWYAPELPEGKKNFAEKMGDLAGAGPIGELAKLMGQAFVMGGITKAVAGAVVAGAGTGTLVAPAALPIGIAAGAYLGLKAYRILDSVVEKAYNRFFRVGDEEFNGILPAGMRWFAADIEAAQREYVEAVLEKFFDALDEEIEGLDEESIQEALAGPLEEWIGDDAGRAQDVAEALTAGAEIDGEEGGADFAMGSPIGSATSSPQAEIDRLFDATAEPITDAIHALMERVAHHVFNQAPIVVQYDPALRDLEEVLAKAMMFADGLGRIRVVGELKSEGVDPGAKFAAEPEDFGRILKRSIDEGVENLVGRQPVVAESAEELRDLYSTGQVFGMSRASKAVLQTAETLTRRVQAHLEEHLVEGRDFDDFADFLASLEEAGFDRPYAETVYRTNLQGAYNHGRDRQAERLGDFVVGFEFLTAGDADVRENHQAAHGFRAPVDHPAWDRLTPPLGYRCRCVKRVITRPEAEREGWLDEGGQLKVHEPPGFAAAGPDLPTFGRRP